MPDRQQRQQAIADMLAVSRRALAAGDIESLLIASMLCAEAARIRAVLDGEVLH